MAETVPTNIDIAAATATTPKLNRSVADQAIGKYIRGAGRFLEEARINPDVVERLAEAGYDDEELSYGMELQDKAWSVYCAHHGDCPPDHTAGSEELDRKVEEARDAFTAFRLIARAAFPTLDARLDLCVMGDVPEDLQRFINAAHSGYAAAGTRHYGDKLSKRGYPPEKLKTLSDGLDAIANLEGTLDAAGEAPDNVAMNTDERDEAYIALKEYMKEIKGVARAMFRVQPEVLARLGL